MFSQTEAVTKHLTHSDSIYLCLELMNNQFQASRVPVFNRQPRKCLDFNELECDRSLLDDSSFRRDLAIFRVIVDISFMRFMKITSKAFGPLLLAL